jgi:hypothetical protein
MTCDATIIDYVINDDLAILAPSQNKMAAFHRLNLKKSINCHVHIAIMG